jgi:hypothetical protein
MEVIDRDGAILGAIDDAGRVQTSAQRGSLIISPHPMTLDRQQVFAVEPIAGESLLEFVRRYEPAVTAAGWMISINGLQVPPRMWAKTRPKPGVIVGCRRIVRGDVVKIIAILVISYFTLGAGGLGAGGLFAAGGAIGGGFLAAAAGESAAWPDPAGCRTANQ